MQLHNRRIQVRSAGDESIFTWGYSTTGVFERFRTLVLQPSGGAAAEHAAAISAAARADAAAAVRATVSACNAATSQHLSQHEAMQRYHRSSTRRLSCSSSNRDRGVHRLVRHCGHSVWQSTSLRVKAYQHWPNLGTSTRHRLTTQVEACLHTLARQRTAYDNCAVTL